MDVSSDSAHKFFNQWRYILQYLSEHAFSVCLSQLHDAIGKKNGVGQSGYIDTSIAGQYGHFGN
jgi:hypothetical protein